MKTRIACPICGFKAEIDDFEEGSTVECPQCAERFQLEMSVIDTETSDEAKEEIPESQETLPPSPPVAPVPAGLPPQEQESKAKEEKEEKPQEDSSGQTQEGESTLNEFPEGKYHQPILSGFIEIFIFLDLVVVGLFSLYMFSEGNGLSKTIGFVALIITIIIDLFIYGFAQILNYIGEIRFHSIRQTNLLIKILRETQSPRD